MASQIKVSVILKALAETKGFQAVNQELRSIELQTKRSQPSLDAMKTGRTFPEQNNVFDQYRSAPSPTE